MDDKEPIEQAPSELFPQFERLSQIGLDIGDDEARNGFVSAVLEAEEITEAAEAFVSQLGDSVEAQVAAEIELAIGDEKAELQHKQQILIKVAQIILLLKTRDAVEDRAIDAAESGNEQEEDHWLNLAEDLNSKALDEVAILLWDLESRIEGIKLHKDYFQQIALKARELLGDDRQ